MNIAGDWLDRGGTQALCAALGAAGYEALLVGGCVRNALLGLAVTDIDIASDARPEIVTNIAESAGFRVIPTGFDHGTVTVLALGIAHEVTTFRRDVQTDGRHAVVAYATEVAEDAARRDFTMNALYATASGAVIDPLGGLPDLQAGRVRFVGQAAARIAEDYLRILRFFRFHAIYGDPTQGIDAEGYAACASMAEGLDKLSRERVGGEMRKLLAAADPAPALASMAQAGILARVLVGADPRGIAPLVHLEAGIAPRWQRRLAVLTGTDPTDALRLSRAEAADFGKISDEIGSSLTPAALAWKLGAVLAQDVVLCRATLLEQRLPDGWSQDIARGSVARCPVGAADLMADHSGAALGQRLRGITARWLQSDLRLGRQDLLG